MPTPGTLFAAACVWLLAHPFASAQPVFSNGFESPCSTQDADGDRLDECQELQHQTLPGQPDTDGDGITDGDEVLGTPGGLNLPALGVDPRRKDILLEYDWFDDALEAGFNELCPPAATHSHRPTDAMLVIVTAMFRDAPVSNPNGVPGINVIHDAGQGGVFHRGNLVSDADGKINGDVFSAEYNAIRAAHFAPERVGYFHYVLVPHRYAGANGNQNSSGYAAVFGEQVDRRIVSLACAATVTNVGNTIAHELGHNLRLHHGGDPLDACNNKPNYNSIMNYLFQFDGVDDDCSPGWSIGRADFSRDTRLTLDENALNEATGMCNAPIDWNFNLAIDAALSLDLNEYPNQTAECGGVKTVLRGHDDWAAIVIPIASAAGGGAGGAETPSGYACPPPPAD